MISVEFRDWLNDQVLTYLPVDRIRQGDQVIVRCPICGDSKKNALKKRGYYYLNTASYHCFNCDANYTGMKLLELLSGSDYNDLKQQYFKMAFNGKYSNGVTDLSSNNNANGNVLNLKCVIKPEHKHALSETARRYLDERLVTSAPFLKEKLYSYYNRKGDEYILIPWRINGVDSYYQLNDFLKHNTIGMKYIFPKSLDKLVYGLDNIDISFPYIICFEGVYDSLFVPNGIAIGGKTLTELQSKIIHKRFPHHKIVYALDNDLPGLTATARVLNNNTTSMDFSFFRWFDNSTVQKDINDYVKAKNNVNIFKDKLFVEQHIVDPISMKLWLGSKNITIGTVKIKKYARNMDNEFKFDFIK